MRIFRIALEAVRGLKSNKVNLVLMMLGIIIGIASLTVIVSIGEGAKTQILSRISQFGFGSEAVYIGSGAGKVFSHRRKKANTLTLQDAEILGELENVKLIAPYQGKRLRTIYKKESSTTRINGITPEWFTARTWNLTDGDYISDEDLIGMRKVCVIGVTPMKKLFKDEDPIGKFVRINKVYFKVIGIMEEKGVSESGYDPDDRIVIPLTTSARRLFQQVHINSIRLQLHDAHQAKDTIKQVRSILRERHHLATTAEDDFRIITPDVLVGWITESKKTLTVMLGMISTISLLVSGIVIMNIMLVSVNERIKEIGIKRSFGAKKSDILMQFLLESTFVSLSGGMIGLVLGGVINFFISTFSRLKATMSLESFVLAFIFSVLVGILFGLQPARKATLMNPVQALR
ncbi:MAG TPA: ABC transporter permease [Nitrospinota bacterium]|jgi:putative ABC transport system permease protein|nr:ABC transporter permease [Nitrospinota bacterium]